MRGTGKQSSRRKLAQCLSVHHRTRFPFVIVFVAVVCIFSVFAVVVTFIVMFCVLCFYLNVWLIRVMCDTCVLCPIVVLLPPD
jgi:hypothetical protein